VISLITYIYQESEEELSNQAKRGAQKIKQIFLPPINYQLKYYIMYIEFQLPRKDHNSALVQVGRETLLNELKRWSKQHNLDYYSIRTDYVYGDNLERVYLPSSRAYELFAISWSPSHSYFGDYRLRKS
jgi:hypothetical protein